MNDLPQVHVIGVTWGHVSQDLLALPPQDIILASDVFFEPEGDLGRLLDGDLDLDSLLDTGGGLLDPDLDLDRERDLETEEDLDLDLHHRADLNLEGDRHLERVPERDLERL
ncbi:hypothetical protein CB1_000265017 [Camelus ferus]|nr:hypothetical protein CB1_000265017 [Camelus ferus]